MALTPQEAKEFQELYGFKPGSSPSVGVPTPAIQAPSSSGISSEEKKEFEQLYGFSPGAKPITQAPPPTSTKQGGLFTQQDKPLVLNALKELAFGLLPGSRQAVTKFIAPVVKEPLKKHDFPSLLTIPQTGIKDLGHLIKAIASAPARLGATAGLTLGEAGGPSLYGKDFEPGATEVLGGKSLQEQRRELQEVGAGPVVERALPAVQFLMDALISKHMAGFKAGGKPKATIPRPPEPIGVAAEAVPSVRPPGYYGMKARGEGLTRTPNELVLDLLKNVKKEPLEKAEVPIPEGTDLIQEAKKFKSADEFVNSQTPYFHGTNEKFDVFDLEKTKGAGFYFTKDKGAVKEFGENVKEVYIRLKNPAPKKEVVEAFNIAEGIKGKYLSGTPTFKDSTTHLSKQVREILSKKGYDGYYGELLPSGKGYAETVAFNSDSILTKSQLTDFYNQATKVEVPIPEDVLPWEVGKSNRELAMDYLEQGRKPEVPAPKGAKVPIPSAVERAAKPTKIFGEIEVPRQEVIDFTRMDRKDMTPFGLLRDPKPVLENTGVWEYSKGMFDSYQNVLELAVKDMNKRIGGLKRHSNSDYKVAEFLNEHTTREIQQMAQTGGWEGRLTPEEFRIANEARGIFDGLFEITGLPKERYIDTYITWLKDKVEGGEVPGWEVFIPKEISSRFTKLRTGETPQKISLVDSLRAYAPSVIKTSVYNKYLPTIKKYINELPPNRKIYAEQLMDRILGRPTWFDTMVDNSLSAAGRDIKPMAATRSAIWLQNRLFAGILGGNIPSAAKNLVQSINTAAEVGFLPTFKGAARLLTKEGRKTFKESSAMRSYEQMFDKDVSWVKTFDDIAFKPWEFGEYLNRGVAFNSTYPELLKQGMSKAEALKKAVAVSDETQFIYGKLGRSPFIDQMPMGRLFAMFTSFPRKQIEFLNHLRKNNKAGFLRYTLMVGMATTVLGEKALDLLIPKPLEALPVPKRGNPATELLMGAIELNPKRFINAASNLITGRVMIKKLLKE